MLVVNKKTEETKTWNSESMRVFFNVCVADVKIVFAPRVKKAYCNKEKSLVAENIAIKRHFYD